MKQKDSVVNVCYSCKDQARRLAQCKSNLQQLLLPLHALRVHFSHFKRDLQLLLTLRFRLPEEAMHLLFLLCRPNSNLKEKTEKGKVEEVSSRLHSMLLRVCSVDLQPPLPTRKSKFPMKQKDSVVYVCHSCKDQALRLAQCKCNVRLSPHSKRDLQLTPRLLH
jgi:hypothetical protein